MPFYRHECESCGHRFRILELAGSDKPVTCPSCGHTKTRRLLSRVSVQFKGSGYYKTDHASKQSNTKPRGSSESDSSDATSSNTSSATTSNAKPEKAGS